MLLQVDILLANPLRLATLADEGKIDLSHVRGVEMGMMANPVLCVRMCMCVSVFSVWPRPI